jgi:putative oligomerization/nucleic acid binding protein
MRAAMVGGGAYYAGKKVQQGREQDARKQNLETAPAAPAAGGISDATIDQLKKLGDLKDQGVLTQEEFDQQKQKLLATA